MQLFANLMLSDISDFSEPKSSLRPMWAKPKPDHDNAPECANCDRSRTAQPGAPLFSLTISLAVRGTSKAISQPPQVGGRALSAQPRPGAPIHLVLPAPPRLASRLLPFCEPDAAKHQGQAHSVIRRKRLAEDQDRQQRAKDRHQVDEQPGPARPGPISSTPRMNRTCDTNE